MSDALPLSYLARHSETAWTLSRQHDTLLTHGDYYMHLADLASYLEADGKLRALYADPDAWARNVILDIASSGKFSSDRAIAEYAADIWRVKPCPVS